MNPDVRLLALLRQIKDRPDDDAPRLVLADLLQDHGDVRGEFLHAQVVRGRLPDDAPHARALYRRERQILRDRAFDWLGPLADFASAWSFLRGLIHLELRGTRGEVPDLTRCPAVPWVEGASLSDGREAELEVLARRGLLAQLCRLELTCERPTRLAGLALPEAAQLRELTLAGPVADAEAVALAEAASLRNLRRLDATKARLGDAGREALAAAFARRVRFAEGRDAT